MFNSWQLSTKVVSIENHEIQISRFVFHAYPSYLCRVSFFTTLEIYKDYFKGCLRWCNLMQSDYSLKYCDQRQFALVHLSLVKAAVSLRRGFCNQGVSWSSSFGWTEELCSQHLSQVGVLVTYWDPCINWLVTYLEPCIEMRNCHYITSPIVYWGKGSTVGWYWVLGFLLLVTTYFDNSGFSRVMT